MEMGVHIGKGKVKHLPEVCFMYCVILIVWYKGDGGLVGARADSSLLTNQYRAISVQPRGFLVYFPRGVLMNLEFLTGNS